MIIRRKMPRIIQRKAVGISGQKALSTATSLARRMTVARLPDPSSISSETAIDTPVSPTAPSSLFESMGEIPRGHRGPVTDVSTSRTMPKDLQAIFDRHATPEMRAQSGMRSSGFIKDIIQRNKQALEEQKKGRFTRPRPENVRFEPQSIQRETDTVASEEIDFPEQPTFETKRTRSIFEYVNVSSPDKVQAQREQEPPSAISEEDLPDALPGSYDLDDDQPTESFDVSTLTDSPKAEAPQAATTIQRAPDETSSFEGLSDNLADTIQRDVDDDIESWSGAERGMEFESLEYPASRHDGDEVGIDSANDTITHHTPQQASTSSSIQRRTNAEQQSTGNSEQQGMSSDTSTPPSSAKIQRSTDTSQTVESSAATPSVQRKPSNPQDIQRDVASQIETWHTEEQAFASEPLTYAPSEDISSEGISEVSSAAKNSDLPVSQSPETKSQAHSSSIQRQEAEDVISSPSSPSENVSSPTTGNIQRRADTSLPSETKSVQRSVSEPSQIQREIEDEIEHWRNDETDFEGETLFYEPNQSTSQSAENIQRAVSDLDQEAQQHITPSPTESFSSETLPSAQSLQRHHQESAPQLPSIEQGKPKIQRRSTTNAEHSPDISDTPVQRAFGQDAPQYVQRSVDDEIQEWQSHSSNFAAEPLTYAHDMPSTADVSTADVQDMGIDHSTSKSPSSTAKRSIQRQPTHAENVDRPVIRRSTNAETSTPQHTSSMVQRSSSSADYIQREVADEITTWQQSQSSMPDFASEAPDWQYASSEVASPNIGGAIQREATEDLEDVEASPLAQDLFEAGFIQQAPTSTPSSVQRKKSATGNSSLTSELLTMLDLPPDTPIDTDSPSITVGVDATSVQRMVEGAPIQRDSIDDAAVSEPVSDDAGGDDNSAQDAAKSGKNQDQQIEEMAEKVYSILRRRFRIEIERNNGR